MQKGSPMVGVTDAGLLTVEYRRDVMLQSARPNARSGPWSKARG